MSVRTCAALILAVGLPTAVYAANFPEIEPNETKAQALANGPFVLAAGDSVSGVTTGTSTVAGLTSGDTFLIKTTPAALGIYRHRLTITTAGAVGHTGTLRGLNASSSGPGTTDTAIQTSTSSTTPARMNQWYGFGRQEQTYYRVTGTTTTTADYVATLSTSVVVPSVFPLPVESGSIGITHDAATNTAYDMDMFLFDANFNPIAGIDEPDTAALTATLAPGVYYIAYAPYNLAAGRASGSSIIQGTWQTGAVFDFDGPVMASTAANRTQPIGIDIAHSGGTVHAEAVTPGGYDVAWFTFTVNPPTTPTNPTATDSVTPNTVVRDGVAQVTLAVTVVPGQVPVSTGLAVTVNDSSIGGSGSLALLDNGVGADLIAGDNIFTGTTTVAYTTALGAATLPYTVTDAQSRSFSDALNFTVTEATGACCTASGCVTIAIADCIDNLDGTFAGTGTACFTGPFNGSLSTDGAGAFEDIAATGTLVAFPGTDDEVSLVSIPFNFTFFGNTYTSMNVCTNGFVQFTGNSTAFTNGAIPSAGVPNNAIYALWDDLNLYSTGSVHTQMLGTIGTDARFIIQWNAGQYNGLNVAPTDLSVFQIVLYENGSFDLRYQSVSGETGTAGAADTTTIGFENADGTFAVQSSETRSSLSTSAPASFRGNASATDTGVCGSACPACAADYDQDGGVSGSDIGAFFADYELGDACADVDQDGGISGADIGAFFAQFEAGGC